MSALVGVQEAVRTTEVDAELSRLIGVTEFIDKISVDLEGRLSKSILAQRQESNAETSSQPEPVRVPLAQSIHARVEHLESIRERLSSILGRLEA